MTPILAWRGDPDLKAAAVERMRAHREADTFVQGTYVEEGAPEAGTGFRGCFHGCLTAEALMAEQGVRSVTAIRFHRGWHDEGQRLFGIPADLGMLLDRVFEALDPTECATFAVNTVEAMPVGADLSRVVDAVARDVLADELYGMRALTLPDTRTRRVVDVVVGLYKRRIAGDEPTRSEWRAAGDEADGAYMECGGVEADAAVLANDLAGDTDPDDLVEARNIAPSGFTTWLAARIVHHLAAAPAPAGSGVAS